LEKLKNLFKLKVLKLGGFCGAGDEGILAIAQNCKNIEILSLSIGTYTGASVAMLTDNLHNLRELTLNESNKLNDENAASIAKGRKKSQLEIQLEGCPNIEKLIIGNAPFTDEGFRFLGSSCHDLTVLNINFNKNITGNTPNVTTNNNRSRFTTHWLRLSQPKKAPLRFCRFFPVFRVSHFFSKINRCGAHVPIEMPQTPIIGRNLLSKIH
jgi:hypothetical protein